MRDRVTLKDSKSEEVIVQRLDTESYERLKLKITEFKRNNTQITDSITGIKPSTIEAIGDPKVSEEFLKEYIEHYKHKNITHAKCYAFEFKNNITVHFDCKSSWNCIMNMLNQPDYVAIYKINKI